MVGPVILPLGVQGATMTWSAPGTAPMLTFIDFDSPPYLDLHAERATL
jgi:hypothetical protein